VGKSANRTALRRHAALDEPGEEQGFLLAVVQLVRIPPEEFHRTGDCPGRGELSVVHARGDDLEGVHHRCDAVVFGF